MKKRRRLLPLLVSMVMIGQMCPLNLKAEYRYAPDWEYYAEIDWVYSNPSDAEKEYIATGLRYTGTSSDIYIPDTIDGLRIESVFVENTEWENITPNDSGTITFHIPDARYGDISVYDYGLDAQYSNLPDWIKSVDVVYTDDLVTYYVDHSDPLDLYEGETTMEMAAKVWDYRILDKLDGVYDGPCVELLRYKGKRGEVDCPLQIEGYPVALISGQIFKDNFFVSVFNIPMIIEEEILDTEEEDKYVNNYRDKYENYYEYLADHPKDYGLEWPEIQLADGCLYSEMPEFSVCFCPYQYSAEYRPYEPEGHRLCDIRWYGYSYGENLYFSLVNHDDGSKSWDLELIRDIGENEVKVPGSLAGYPVSTIGNRGYYNENSAEPDLSVILPDSIKLIQPWAFLRITPSRINIPESVKILPHGCLGNYEFYKEIKGIENVPFVSDELFATEDVRYSENWRCDISKWEHLVNKDNLVHFNYTTDDLLEPFYITDPATGNVYEVNIDEDDYSISLKLVYLPDKNQKIPTEFRGFPVEAALSDKIPKGAKIVVSGDSFGPKNMVFVNNICDESDEWYKSSKKKNEFIDFNEYESQFTNDIEITSKNVRLESDAFLYAKPKSLDFPGSAYLSKFFLYHNETTEKLSFTGTASEITFEEKALQNNSSVTEVNFPKKCSDLNIGDSAFYGCKLRSLTLPEGTSNVGKNAFSKNSEMKDLTINGSPKIGDEAFKECGKLRTVTINGKPDLGENVFLQCYEMTNLNVDMSAKLNASVFNTCENLTQINGEEVFNEDGSPKEKYRKYIEENFVESNNNGIINKYVDYRVKQLVAETVTDDMNDMQKVRALHDKLCSMVSYDTDNVDAPKNHTDVSVFLCDTSVCDGYARAYNLLLHEAGIKSCFVYNDDHAWVIAEVGGHWFHIDPTWDDGDVLNYDWFMRNDAQIKDKDMHGSWKLLAPSALHRFQWYSLPKCNDIMGDVNSDGMVDGRDASAILSAYAKASLGEELEVDMVLSDYDFNGIIDARDASAVLTEYAKSSVDSD